MPATPSSSLLMRKWGPLPVWVWGGIGLGAAYLYSKHKAAATATSSTVAGAAQPSTTTPDFVIENNLPAGGWGSPSQVIVSPPAPVTVTPPGTTPSPPVLQGGHPPQGPGGPISATPPTAAPAPAPPAAPTPRPGPIQYKVVHGDNLSTIAARYHTTWQSLWSYNTAPGNRPASTIATLLQRGPNLLYAGETILIPQ
jgi:LysM repeat protein